MAMPVAVADLKQAYWREGQTLVDLGRRYGRSSPGIIHKWFDSWTRRGRYLRAVYACSSIKFVRALVRVLMSFDWSPRVWKHKTTLNQNKFTGYRIESRAAHSRELAQWLYRDPNPSIRCTRSHKSALQRSDLEVQATARVLP